MAYSAQSMRNGHIAQMFLACLISVFALLVSGKKMSGSTLAQARRGSRIQSPGRVLGPADTMRLTNLRRGTGAFIARARMGIVTATPRVAARALEFE
jgi:hypothetical protein